MKKTILVLGATGTQGPSFKDRRVSRLVLLVSSGGAVAKVLLQYPEKYIVRCLTRNPNSDKAKALSALGGELAQADLTVPSTLPEAFKGAWGVFAVTDFYDTVFSSFLHHSKSLTSVMFPDCP
jgi:NmrA-like family